MTVSLRKFQPCIRAAHLRAFRGPTGVSRSALAAAFFSAGVAAGFFRVLLAAVAAAGLVLPGALAGGTFLDGVSRRALAAAFFSVGVAAGFFRVLLAAVAAAGLVLPGFRELLAIVLSNCLNQMNRC